MSAGPELSAEYVATPMGADGHRWLARSVPGARHQIAVTGLTEAEARANFEDAWRAWNDLCRAQMLAKKYADLIGDDRGN